MSSDRYLKRKTSRGILKTRTNDGYQRDDRKQHQRIQIYVQNPAYDDDASSVNSEREFERLKNLYYKECRKINRNLVKKCGNQNESTSYNPDILKCSSFAQHSHDNQRSYRQPAKEPFKSKCRHCLCHLRHK